MRFSLFLAALCASIAITNTNAILIEEDDICAKELTPAQLAKCKDKELALEKAQ